MHSSYLCCQSGSAIMNSTSNIMRTNNQLIWIFIWLPNDANRHDFECIECIEWKAVSDHMPAVGAIASIFSVYGYDYKSSLDS